MNIRRPDRYLMWQALEKARFRLQISCLRSRWIVDGANEEQCAAAPVFDRTEERPIDDHLKRLLRAYG